MVLNTLSFSSKSKTCFIIYVLLWVLSCVTCILGF
uniref:Uncharacterized protein n=1 Tax=Rhizophora mucronata TaxID=61149 RepID=A0A2P2PYW0_RHIMU